jgi:hypothetical protein
MSKTSAESRTTLVGQFKEAAGRVLKRAGGNQKIQNVCAVLIFAFHY